MSAAFCVLVLALMVVGVLTVCSPAASATPIAPADPSTAEEGGYVAPQAGLSPHGGYSASSNKCKVCHAVHGAASGGEVLLRTTNIYHNDNKYLGGTWEADCRWCHSSSPDYGSDYYGTPAPPLP